MNLHRVPRPKTRNLLVNSLLYADRGIIVLNKPSGLICQTGKHAGKDGSSRNSAAEIVLEDIKNYFALDKRPAHVHRLDKLTTGAWLLSRYAANAHPLSQQFQTRAINKSYLALVRGGRKSFPQTTAFPPPLRMNKDGRIRETEKQRRDRKRTETSTAPEEEWEKEGRLRGQIDAPLVVNDEGIVSLDYSDMQKGKVALTEWELIGSSDTVPLSLVRLKLHSGLKHQLRVHLAHVLRCPILGDTLYSLKAPTPEILSFIPPEIDILGGIRTNSSESSSGLDIPPLPNPTSPSPALFLHASHINLERYHRTGYSRFFRLGISAPLPWYFVEVCQAAGLGKYLRKVDLEGGLDVDGKAADLGRVKRGMVGAAWRGIGLSGEWRPDPEEEDEREGAVKSMDGSVEGHVMEIEGRWYGGGALK